MLGMGRVITRPEIDPTRSKEAKYPTHTRPESLGGRFDPSRPVPEYLEADPTRCDPSLIHCLKLFKIP